LLAIGKHHSFLAYTAPRGGGVRNRD